MRACWDGEALPEELQIEILSWVPVKHLMRLRCVSKWWNTLVLDPSFVQLHLRRCSKTSHVLLFVVDDWVGPCSIDGLLEDPSSTIDGCDQFDLDFVMSVCNGLVCTSHFSYLEDTSDGVYYFKFWNPATRIESPDLAHDNGCFLSHTINWLAVHKFCYEWEAISINEVDIVSYDLKKETFRYLSMPRGLVEKPVRKPTLEILKGCLCLYDRGKTHFTVWLMREFGVDNSWTQLLKVSYERLQFRKVYGHSLPAPVILCMSQSEDVMLLADTSDNRITLYNKRNNVTDVFTCKRGTTFYSFDYVQSLAWPGHMGVVGE